MGIIGCARVSTTDQNPQLQLNALDDVEQTRAQVLDLRIAIIGLTITVVGLALALCA